MWRGAVLSSSASEPLTRSSAKKSLRSWLKKITNKKVKNTCVNYKSIFQMSPKGRHLHQIPTIVHLKKSSSKPHKNFNVVTN